MNANESYRNNLIERLDKFYKVLLKEAEDYRKLAKAVVDNEHYYDGGHFMANGLAVKFKAAFTEELTSNKLPAEI